MQRTQAKNKNVSKKNFKLKKNDGTKYASHHTRPKIFMLLLSEKKYVSLILATKLFFCVLFFSPLDFLHLSLSLSLFHSLSLSHTHTHTHTHNSLILHHSTGKTNQTCVVGQLQSDIPTKKKTYNLNFVFIVICTSWMKRKTILWDYDGSETNWTKKSLVIFHEKINLQN